MDLWTVWTIALIAVAYSIGKGIGRAQGREAQRRETPPHICISIELEGEVIGGLHLGGMRAGHNPIGDTLFPPEASGPPPGHPEAER